jgi:hypothetical protein
MDNVRAVLATAAFVLEDSTPPPARPPTVTCTDICSDVYTMTPQEVLCIEDVLARAGFPQPPECDNVTSPAECNACFTALGLLTGDCSILSFRCL